MSVQDMYNINLWKGSCIMIKILKDTFFAFSIPLQVIILMLVCGGVLFLLNKVVCKLRNEKVYIVRKSDKEYLQKLILYNSKYCEMQYETMREMIYKQISIDETRWWIAYLNDTDLILNKGASLYMNLKLSGNKELCDIYESESTKYKISKLYELLLIKRNN